MANPSKRYPHICEIYVPSLDKWFPLGSFRTKEEAEDRLEALRKHDPKQTFRLNAFYPGYVEDLQRLPT